MGIELDVREVSNRVVKYIVQGLAVSVASMLLLKKNADLGAVTTLGLVSASVFAVLDLFLPAAGAASRQGVGLASGFQMMSFP